VPWGHAGGHRGSEPRALGQMHLVSDPATAAPEQSPALDQAAAQVDDVGLAQRLHLAGVLRIGVGLVGLIGLVLGMIIAWRANSATTLLIVAGLLLILAALGLDWEEIRGGYGGANLAFLRRGLRNVEGDLDRVASNEAVPDAVRQELAPVRDELEELRSKVEDLTPQRPRPRRAATREDFQNLDRAMEGLMRTKATHSFRGSDAVELTLLIVARATARYQCTVKTPTGEAFNAIARGTNWSSVAASTYSVLYPNEFVGSEPFVAGRYEVEWRAAPPTDVGPTRSLAMTLGYGVQPPIATDSFTIPEAREPPDAGSS
jgi:hypothetical protein